MPELILISIATTLATKTATSLYDLVKKKFTDRNDRLVALEAAQSTDPASVEALAIELDRAGQDDPTFAEALHSEWTATQVNQHATDNAACTQTPKLTGRHSEIGRQGPRSPDLRPIGAVRGNRTAIMVAVVKRCRVAEGPERCRSSVSSRRCRRKPSSTRRTHAAGCS